MENEKLSMHDMKNHQATWLSDYNKLKYSVYNRPPLVEAVRRNKNLYIFVQRNTRRIMRKGVNCFVYTFCNILI